MNQTLEIYQLENIEIQEHGDEIFPEYHFLKSEDNQASTLFMSTVFHELCTQINNISCFANCLKQTNHQYTEQEKIQSLHSMQTAVQELNQLLQYATRINWTEEEKKLFLSQVRNLTQNLAKHKIFHNIVNYNIAVKARHDSNQAPSSIFPAIPQLNKVFDFIEAHYKEQITVYSLAQAIGYSPTYLSNLVKSKTGQTIHTWIVQRRMVAAKSLLLETDWSVNKIAAEVGYPDPGHFIRQFRQIYNITPKSWRNKAQIST